MMNSIMTRKHFEQLADVLRGCHPSLSQVDEPTEAEVQVWEACRDGVAAVCNISNENFSYAKFVKATTPKPEPAIHVLTL